MFHSLSALGAAASNLWLWSSRIWVRNLHIPEWCLQLWSGYVRTFDRPSVPWQVRIHKKSTLASVFGLFVQLIHYKHLVNSLRTSWTVRVLEGSNFWSDGQFRNFMILMHYQAWLILLWMESTQPNHCRILRTLFLDAFRWAFVSLNLNLSVN